MSIIFEVYDRQIICNVSSGYSLVNVYSYTTSQKLGIIKICYVYE